MDYANMLRLQKCLFINLYLYFTWVLVNGYFLYTKIERLGHLSKYLSVTVFILLTVLEIIRLYLGNYGNLSCRVPELGGFLMLTVLMQMPLVSFFLFNSYLDSTPVELILHAGLWGIIIIETVYSFLALKQASSVAKTIYLSHSKDISVN
nr:transmembrane protein 17-like [Vanessa tameamea]